jgi:hypothetical protein
LMEIAANRQSSATKEKPVIVRRRPRRCSAPTCSAGG